jgi:uncharacterized RDD family membrane protein YckC
VTTTPLQSLEQQVDVETPEQVVISYTIAGVGSRSAAALLDYALCVLLILVLVVAGINLASIKGTGAWAIALLMLVGFVVFWGYYVLFEGLWDGQTPGKRQLGLRVVRDGGYSVTFGASAVRNLLRIVDGQPGLSYGVGLLSVVLSRSGKRLGDYAAGTIRRGHNGRKRANSNTSRNCTWGGPTQSHVRSVGCIGSGAGDGACTVG